MLRTNLDLPVILTHYQSTLLVKMSIDRWISGPISIHSV